MTPTPISGATGPSPAVAALGQQSDSPTKPKADPILEALKPGVLQLINEDVRAAIDPEKIQQYAQIRYHELYWRGNQYLDEIYDSKGNTVDYRPMGLPNPDGTQNDNLDGLDSYDTVINDVRGYGRKF